LGLALQLASGAWAQQPPPLLKEYIRLGSLPVAEVKRPKPSFSDVPETSPYFAATGLLKERAIALGYADGTYAPATVLDRGQMAVFLVRAVRSAKGLNPDPQPGEYYASPHFSDVQPTFWAFAHVQTLKEMGLTDGCGSGLYCPDVKVTHAQMATFTGRAIQYLKTGNGMTELDYRYRFPAQQCFLDAIPGAVYFPHAQLLGEMGVLDKICGAATLPVAGEVTRGETALYLARGIFAETDQ
jgi:hypothetical protein